MSRFKSAAIVFVVLAGALITAFTFDYTDTYVAKRFQKALDSGRYEQGVPFSLDAFLEYYDWDNVCVVLPGADYDFTNRAHLPHFIKKDDADHWTLVFVKSYYVIAEISINRDQLEPPTALGKTCFERWKAIIEIVDYGGTPSVRFVGD